MNITHERIAQELRLARSTVTRILNNDPTYRASAKTRKKVFALAAQLNYNFSNLRRIHRRKYERIPVSIPVGIRIILPDGSVFAEGKARLLDLNPAGALVGEFEIQGNVVPLTAFSLGIEVGEGDLAGLKVVARIARIIVDDAPQMGVEFVDAPPEVTARLTEYLQMS